MKPDTPKPPWLPADVLESVGSSDDLRSTFLQVPLTRFAPSGRQITTTRTYTLIQPSTNA